MSRFKRRWLVLFLPLLLIEPILRLIKDVNRAFWSSARNAFEFLESNPLVTILILIIILLLAIRKN